MGTNQIMSLAFPILLILIFYFMLIRPQKKREKQINAMRKNLKVGDQIVTIGGIFGKVYRIKDDKLTIEVADKTKFEMARWSISSVVTEAKAPKVEKEENVKEIEEPTDKKEEV